MVWGAGGRSTRKEEQQPQGGRIICAKAQVGQPLWQQCREADGGQIGRALWALERAVGSHGRILTESIAAVC